MREILFRGKRLDNGEWIVGQLIRYNDGRARIVESGENIFCYEMDISIIQTVAHHVDPSTVGQYTEICDKNGKNIVEGDILSGYFSAGVWVNGLVEFKDGSFGISWKWGDGRQFAAFTSITHSVEFEIIGNIHDNPELLEVSHETD